MPFLFCGGKNVLISPDEAYVNDMSVTMLGGNADLDGVAPGKSAICAFSFGYADMGIESIDDIKKVEFKIRLRDSDDFSNVLLETDTITVNFDKA